MDIRKLIKEENIIIGNEETLKGLRAGTIQKVVIASNCSEEIRESIEHYTNVGNIELEVLEVPNDELGILCRKPFSVAVISVPKK